MQNYNTYKLPRHLTNYIIVDACIHMHIILNFSVSFGEQYSINF